MIERIVLLQLITLFYACTQINYLEKKIIHIIWSDKE